MIVHLKRAENELLYQVHPEMCAFQYAFKEFSSDRFYVFFNNENFILASNMR